MKYFKISSNDNRNLKYEVNFFANTKNIIKNKKLCFFFVFMHELIKTGSIFNQNTDANLFMKLVFSV